jgi:23S rRNA (uracil1939-C5)-methyltransferase
LTLRNTATGVVLVVEGGAAGWDAAALVAAAPAIIAVWHRPDGDDDAVLLTGGAAPQARQAEQRDAGAGEPSADIAFMQVNRGAAALLVEHVLRIAGSGVRAIDAYCGTGLYGRELARRGWTVTGIELDEAGCAAAAHDAPPGFSVLSGRVEDHLPSLLPADLLILNPPRAGLDPAVTAALAEGGASRIVYVSCDPATLARDVKALSATYALDDLLAFDLFPQTAHVETVAVLAARA